MKEQEETAEQKLIRIVTELQTGEDKDRYTPSITGHGVTIRKLSEYFPDPVVLAFTAKSLTEKELLEEIRGENELPSFSVLDIIKSGKVLNLLYRNGLTNLFETGFDDTPNSGLKPLNAHRVVKVVKWIYSSGFKKSQKINKSTSSYGVKHIVERRMGKYVSNGELIAAMILAGFNHERHEG